MNKYIIKNSYAKMESFDKDKKFEACFSSNKLEEIIEKAREYAEDEKVMEWCLEEKNGNIKYEDYQKYRTKGKGLERVPFLLFFTLIL